MSKHKELVERLRNASVWSWRYCYGEKSPMIEEAANAIEALGAEVLAWKLMHENTCKSETALMQENIELREQLTQVTKERDELKEKMRQKSLNEYINEAMELDI